MSGWIIATSERARHRPTTGSLEKAAWASPDKGSLENAWRPLLRCVYPSQCVSWAIWKIWRGGQKSFRPKVFIYLLPPPFVDVHGGAMCQPCWARQKSRRARGPPHLRVDDDGLYIDRAGEYFRLSNNNQSLFFAVWCRPQSAVPVPEEGS